MSKMFVVDDTVELIVQWPPDRATSGRPPEIGSTGKVVVDYLNGEYLVNFRPGRDVGWICKADELALVEAAQPPTTDARAAGEGE